MKNIDWKKVRRESVIGICLFAMGFLPIYVLVFAIHDWVYGAIGVPLLVLGYFALKPYFKYIFNDTE